MEKSKAMGLLMRKKYEGPMNTGVEAEINN
jgi:hypothetical protein